VKERKELGNKNESSYVSVAFLSRQQTQQSARKWCLTGESNPKSYCSTCKNLRNLIKLSIAHLTY